MGSVSKMGVVEGEKKKRKETDKKITKKKKCKNKKVVSQSSQ